jgi:hypothetical protein
VLPEFINLAQYHIERKHSADVYQILTQISQMIKQVKDMQMSVELSDQLLQTVADAIAALDTHDFVNDIISTCLETMTEQTSPSVNKKILPLFKIDNRVSLQLLVDCLQNGT